MLHAHPDADARRRFHAEMQAVSKQPKEKSEDVPGNGNEQQQAPTTNSVELQPA